MSPSPTPLPPSTPSLPACSPRAPTALQDSSLSLPAPYTTGSYPQIAESGVDSHTDASPLEPDFHSVFLLSYSVWYASTALALTSI